MFGKLLKHEWIVARKLVGTICMAVFAAGILSGGVLRYMAWSAAIGSAFMVTLYTIVLTLSLLVILGSCFGTKYLMIYRFFKSRFGDEGHLTFTLPVTRSQLLLSKTLNACIWLLARRLFPLPVWLQRGALWLVAVPEVLTVPRTKVHCTVAVSRW